MALSSQAIQDYIRTRALALGDDPAAVLAVGSVESGGFTSFVGDSGSSFGPFQLHVGGRLPSTIPTSQALEWSLSPAGLDYALAGIDREIHGLTGFAAIDRMVRNFEAPADPGREISAAESRYSQYQGGGPATAPATAEPQMASATSTAAQTGGRCEPWCYISPITIPIHIDACAGCKTAADLIPGNPITKVGDFLSLVTSASFWIRAGEIIGGILLLWLGLTRLTRIPGPGSVASAALPG